MLTPGIARRILANLRPVDFHALTSREVDHLLAAADLCGYRKPRNANGSRARYFHTYLQRRAAARED